MIDDDHEYVFAYFGHPTYCWKCGDELTVRSTTQCPGEGTHQKWTGPLPEDWSTPMRQVLLHQVPPHRWPYGPPLHHQRSCALFRRNLATFCDCAASDGGDVEYGSAP